MSSAETEGRQMFHFCTFFDQHYLHRGLALYRSLEEHCRDFRLWVLCMDPATHQILTDLDCPHVRPVALEALERGDEQLLRAKENRTQVEYYFTCTPSWPLYILNAHAEVELITYLDADLFLFADPAPIFSEIAGHSIAIVEHRYPPRIRHFEALFGKYNVGWVSFRRDEQGMRCLNWWRTCCLEWCADSPEEDRFADQKYLDDWPTRFQNVVALQHPGANVAPWNLAGSQIRADADRVRVDGQPLIFYHFHGLKQVTPWLYYPGIAEYKTRPTRVVRRHIYAPYLRALIAANQQLSSCGVEMLRSIRLESGRPVPLFRRWARRVLNVIRCGRNVLTRNYLLLLKGHVV